MHPDAVPRITHVQYCEYLSHAYLAIIETSYGRSYNNNKSPQPSSFWIIESDIRSITTPHN